MKLLDDERRPALALASMVKACTMVARSPDDNTESIALIVKAVDIMGKELSKHYKNILLAMGGDDELVRDVCGIHEWGCLHAAGSQDSAAGRLHEQLENEMKAASKWLVKLPSPDAEAGSQACLIS